jgi:hypothetical protein
VILLLSSVSLYGGILTYADLHGELGIDLEDYRFSGSVRETDRSYSVDRTLSHHYLNLSLSGPLINEFFANYLLSSGIYGSYYRASTEESSLSQYQDPALRSYSGQVTFFPTRPYPLKLYHSKYDDLTLRYESNNRSNVELLQPELAVVRKYKADITSSGGLYQATVSENLKFSSEVTRAETENVRQYDFGEDRDIWLQVSNSRIDSTEDIVTITIANQLPEGAIRVLIDFEIDVSIDRDSFAVVTVDTGYHDVSIIPDSNFNQLDFKIRVPSHSVWKVLYNPPASPNDLDQSMNAARFGLQVGGSGRLQNESMYEYSDQREANQRLTTFLHNFNNTATYFFSRATDLRLLTTYTDNQTSIGNISSQHNKSLLHLSVLSFKRKRGMALSLSHMFNRNSSINGDSTGATIQDITGDLNVVTTRLTYPARRLNYEFDMRNTASLASDNTGYANDQYSTDISNSIQFPFMGVALEPRQQFKFTLNEKEGPHEISREIETRTSLIGEVLSSRTLGDVRVKGLYRYRKKFDDAGSRINRIALIDFSVTKTFSDRYRMMMLSIHENESFGGTLQSSGSQPSQYKASYKVDLQMTPADDVMLTGNYMLITQAITTIQKFGFSINATLPYLKIPVKSYVISELRDLSGAPRQVHITMETKLSYRFRQMVLVLWHTYSREKLVKQTYTGHQIYADLRRSFSIF